ncbi:MAG: aminotransferase class III [Bacteroidetes bacterium HGW-Bacteroidetes-17]|nr:MAG: aminotransferase class III [Bacteroidetes bacterium HGW-Bacteroidetes-17]
MTEINLKELLRPYQLTDFSFKKLEGYISTNFEIVTSGGKKMVFKYYPDETEFSFISEESRLVSYLAKKLDFSFSVAFKNIDGKEITHYPDGSFSRLLNYIEGEFLAETDQTKKLLYQFGKRIAQMDKELSNFQSDTIAVRKIHWDLQHCLLNWPKAKLIQNHVHKKWVDYYFQQFRDEVLPHLPELRSQIIHGDLNDWNVLTKEEDISGFIDFGDMAHSPLINEVAIALTYVMFNKAEPLESAKLLLKGYHETFPLFKEELELLPYLIASRLGASLCHSADAKSKAKDTSYILISEKPALDLLEKWVTYNPQMLKNTFLKACGFAIPNTEKLREELLTSRRKYFGKSLSLSYEKPIYMQQAAFQYMYDAHGNSYLDAYNNIPLVGHNHPKINEAIAKQQRKLNTNTRYLYDPLMDYAEHLLSYFPEPLNKVFFVNSGSAASDLAIRLAQTYTERIHSLVLEHGYHGHTRSAIENSAYKFDGPGGKGSNPYVHKLPLPNAFNGLFNNGNEYFEDAKKRIEELIASAQRPAYFINEPISGCGGQVPLAPGYLKSMKDYLKSEEILTITDEVQTGFGRLGTHFWGFEYHGIIPDIVVMGKPMANGHPVGAVVTTTEIADAFANGMEFFSSFGGNPVSMKAAKAVLEVVEEEGLQKEALETGNYYKSRLNELKNGYPVIGDVRGAGLFLGVEIVHPTDLSPDTLLARTIKEELKEGFVLTSTDGPFDNVIKTKPPLCFNKKNVDEVCDKMEKILKKL